MSINGVRQLRKLVISYNTTAGGSAGLRDYMARFLYRFAEANPAIDIIARPIHLRGVATVTASWLNGRRETVQLANLDATEVSTKLTKLRNRTGRDERDLRFASGRPQFPSVQGRWTVDMNVKNDTSKPFLTINGRPNKPPGDYRDSEITLLTEGMPDPVTGKSWEEVGADSLKHLAEHQVKKAARIKAGREEYDWAKKHPEQALEKQKKMMIEQKALAMKQAAADEAEKKKAKAKPAGKK